MQFKCPLGPNHVVVYFSPRNEINLIDISLISKTPTDSIMWNGRPTYIIMYSWLKERTPLTFCMEFRVPTNWSKPIIDIALTGIYLNDKTHVKTPQFLQFLTDFPKWTNVIAWLGVYEAWVY